MSDESKFQNCRHTSTPPSSSPALFPYSKKDVAILALICVRLMKTPANTQ